MQQIVYFIQKYKYFLLFAVLELFAFLLTVQSKSYHKSKFINSANTITGGFYNTTNSLFDYSSLKYHNQLLAEENTFLKNKLAQNTNHSTDSTLQKYNYISAKVINNTFHKRENYITLNKGVSDSVHMDMGVINSKGVIGIINNVSNKYATVLSILNTQSKINARLKNSHYFGSLTWNGDDYKTATLVDIQRQAPIKIGDTIITDGKSMLFPEGILIGVIKNFQINNKRYENIEITLFNDMSNLGYVQIIENRDRKEIEQLQNSND